MISRSSSHAFSFQPFTMDAVRSGLQTKRFGQTLHLYDRIESTNTTALALAEAGAPEGTLVLAESQTAGRGRRGRPWISPPDANLYFSIILRPSADLHRIGLWTLAAGMAVAQSIERATALPARLKWPNDVLIHQKKVAGLLLESAVHHERVKHVVLGVGINVNILREALPEALRASATSLREELGRGMDRIELLQRILESLERRYHAFLVEPPDRVLEAYAVLSDTLGQSVIVSDPSGEWTGTAIGFSPDGALILRRPDGEQKVVSSGEVIYVRRNHAACD